MQKSSSAEAIEEPLFSSVHSALVFAFHYSMQAYEPSLLGRLLKRREDEFAVKGKGLVGMDGAAQAGFILREVAALHEAERSVIIARRSTDEKERLLAMMALIQPVMACLGTGIHHYRIVDALVQRYFGKKGNLKILAERSGIHPNTMTVKWALIRKRLREIEDRAMALIDSRLVEMGIIE